MRVKLEFIFEQASKKVALGNYENYYY